MDITQPSEAPVSKPFVISFLGLSFQAKNSGENGETTVNTVIEADNQGFFTLMGLLIAPFVIEESVPNLGHGILRVGALVSYFTGVWLVPIAYRRFTKKD